MSKKYQEFEDEIDSDTWPTWLLIFHICLWSAGDAAGKNRAYGGMIAGLSVFGVCVAVIAVLVFKIYMKYKGYSKQIPDDTDGINNIWQQL